ncbi:diaminopimelate epimerase [Bacteroidia bacterium]|nr:diaminopimelate epimerase [Bacteroidia bacterium]
MKFTKMQGIGNDYVYIYGAGDTIKDIPALARKVSDRHFGIGSDGLILIDPSDKYDFTMRMYNADGSMSPMCGNGSRCVGKYVYDKGHTQKTEIQLETGAGIKILTLYPEKGKVKTVKVNMGIPLLAPADIPVNIPGAQVVNVPLGVNDKEYRITCVSMGNPHAILFVEDTEHIDVEGIGKLIENHPLFPKRTNVEFIQVLSPKELKMRVWERGTGETLACGTGACASLVAGVLNGKCERHATLHLLGGDLQIEWAADNHVYMTGGAETVFEGELID